MPEAIEKKSAGQNGRVQGIPFAEMGLLIGRAREFLEAHRGESVSFLAPEDLLSFARKIDLSPRKKGRPEVILSEDAAVELGHPSTVSSSIVLVTYKPELIRHGRITLVGPDFDGIYKAKRRPFAQIVMLALRHDSLLDPFEVEGAQYLTHRLPGYMVRSVPGRLWVRISAQGLASGLRVKTVGSALIAAYMGEFSGVVGVEVLFVTSSEDAVKELAPIATEATILAGRHKKLVLGVNGEVECPELNCETCEEKPVCDNLRDIVIKRRSRSHD